MLIPMATLVQTRNMDGRAYTEKQLLPCRHISGNSLMGAAAAGGCDRSPALAIYVVPKSPADLMRPWYHADNPVVQQNVAALYKLARERFRRHAEWFEAFAERGRVSEISGAHHLFITHPREVLREIDDFVSLLP
jgi:hypothetical protein